MKISKRQLRRIIKEEKQKILKESVADMMDFEAMIDDFAVEVSDMFQEKMLELSKEDPGLTSRYRSFNEEAYRAARQLEGLVAEAISNAVSQIEQELHSGKFSE